MFFAFTFFANAQIVNIPDFNFKAALLSANPSNTIASTETSSFGYSCNNYHTIDTNNDGEIQVSEAILIKFLNINDLNISDLTGITAFTNLQFLNCWGNQLTNLDLSQNINLKHLACFQNQLVNINLYQNNNLETLRCEFNELTNIDISQNSSLLDLNCSNNQLTAIDVTNNFNLSQFFCDENLLTNLNVTQNPNLTNISCTNNLLTSLNLAQNTLLEYLYCSNNQLTNLDVSHNAVVTEIVCGNNLFTNLDLSQNELLFNFNCENSQISTLDFSNNFNLAEVIINDNALLSNLNLKNGSDSWVEFSNCPMLEFICADETELLNIQLEIDNNGYLNCHVNSYCSFTPGGTFYSMEGNTKLDSNFNGCDANDIVFPNLKFNISDGINSGTFIANSSGDYYLPFQAGTYTVTPVLENPTYYLVTPQNIIVDFPTQNSQQDVDFCVNIIPHSDIEVTLIPLNAARPGFNAHYKMVYKNKGNQIENGTVTFTYFQEDALDFVSATPVFDNQNTISVTSIYTWNYTNLQPFETREILVTINLNSPMETPPLNAGDIISIEAQVFTTNTDENLNDNYAAIRQNVVNSFDPNDKTCLEGEIIEPSMVGEYVHYVIRFENTGTYPAENIVVKDMIDTSKFDISTLVPLHGSHEFYTRIKDNKVEFIFENINLDFDDATNDGYVAFKIKTKPTLTVGQSFSNNANIYFDYNFPITTNTYTTTIQALANPSFAFENEFVLYPNPASSTLSIQAKNQMTIQSVEVYNLIGQLVIAVPNATQIIDVTSLETGTYFIKVNTEKGNAVSKFVKE